MFRPDPACWFYLKEISCCVFGSYIIAYRTRMEEFKSLSAEYADGAVVCH